MSIELIQRPTSVIAEDTKTGERIGSFDRTAGASRGTIRGAVVATTYAAWLDKLDEL